MTALPEQKASIPPSPRLRQQHARSASSSSASGSSQLPPPSPTTAIDQIIKGHPDPTSATAQSASAQTQQPSITSSGGGGAAVMNPPTFAHTSSAATTPAIPKNPLETHPTSPPTIYLNLLILEASLRSQYLKVHLRRRKYTVFLLLLTLWTAYFFRAVYVVGPSPYSLVSTFQQLGLLGGIVTALLFWMSGLYAKTMMWPRRFMTNANKGIRIFNVKLVVVKGGFGERVESWKEVFVPRHPLGWRYGLGVKKLPTDQLQYRASLSSATAPGHAHSSSVGSIGAAGGRSRQNSAASLLRRPTPPLQSALEHLIGTSSTSNSASNSPMQSPVLPSITAAGNRSRSQSVSRTAQPIGSYDPDDFLPSGSHVKLVILAKNFSADFREGWELYRTEYWERENERRSREIDAIKLSLHETGYLPPMTNSGVVMGATTPSGGNTPMRGRTARGQWVGGSPVMGMTPSSRRTRSRSRSSNAGGGESEFITSVSGPVGPREQPVKKRSSPLLRDADGRDDLTVAGSESSHSTPSVSRRTSLKSANNPKRHSMGPDVLNKRSSLGGGAASGESKRLSFHEGSYSTSTGL